MNMNYSYGTTLYKSFLTQMYVFMVFITIFYFTMKNA